MKSLLITSVLMAFVVSVVLWIQQQTAAKLNAGLASAGTPNTLVQDDDAEEVDPNSYVPVEKSMHQMMEYGFNPAYMRLQELMKLEDPEREQWKKIREETMVLAEGGNLLLYRLPEEDVEEWQKSAVAIREVGRDLYRAARTRRMNRARPAYEEMIKQCNACHTSHADGKYQLEAYVTEEEGSDNR